MADLKRQSALRSRLALSEPLMRRFISNETTLDACSDDYCSSNEWANTVPFCENRTFKYRFHHSLADQLIVMWNVVIRKQHFDDGFHSFLFDLNDLSDIWLFRSPTILWISCHEDFHKRLELLTSGYWLENESEEFQHFMQLNSSTNLALHNYLKWNTEQ